MSNKWFVDALRECDLNVRDYSGRMMYGKRCVGVVIDGSAMHVAADLIGTLYRDPGTLRELADILRETREDSMGLQTIVYWPSVKWEESFDSEDSDEDEDSEDDSEPDDSMDGDHASALESVYGPDDDGSDDYNPED